MSTALVASSSIAPATARVAQARVGNATSFTYVDPLEHSIGARPGDQAVRYDERWQDLYGHERRRSDERPHNTVHFGGIFVSREVGTAIMQAQAQASLPKGRTSTTEAENQIKIYEFNQALAGTPEASTTNGIQRVSSPR
jgi:hypothetical protein